jgi:hypothetical protein
VRKLRLIGEANPYSSDPADALLPRPPRSAGARLRAILALPEPHYLATFERVNLCRCVWRDGPARAAALRLSRERVRLILLGARVARAFGLDFAALLWHAGPLRLPLPGSPVRIVGILPHPSGRSRHWHDPASAERARDVIYRVQNFHQFGDGGCFPRRPKEI